MSIFFLCTTDTLWQSTINPGAVNNSFMGLMQVHASAHGLRLITFDADGTLYADGAHMDQDNEMINHILTLLQQDEVISNLTA